MTRTFGIGALESRGLWAKAVAAGARIMLVLACTSAAWGQVPSANSPRRFPVLGDRAISVAVGDFNEDGAVDAVVSPVWGVAQGEPRGLSLLLGDGMGGFGPAHVVTWAGADNTFGAEPEVAVADINGDGHLDLAIGVAQPPRSSRCVFLLGDGNGAFTEGGALNLSLSLGRIRLLDLNNDGKLDLVGSAFSLWAGGSNGIVVSLGDGAAGFGPETFFSTGQEFLPSFVHADLNADGKIDIVAITGSTTIGVLLGNGGGGFAPAVSYQMPVNVITATDVRVGDLTGDSKSDIGVVDNKGHLTIFTGDNSGAFPNPPTQIALGNGGASWLGLTDVDGDGNRDFLVRTSDGVIYHRGDGLGGFVRSGAFNAGGHVGRPEIADLNSDGRPDVVIPGGSFLPSLVVLLGDSEGFKTPRVVTTPDAPAPDSLVNGLAIANVNSDSLVDALVNVAGRGAVALGTAGAPFGAMTVFPSCTIGKGLEAFDVTLDGNVDLVGTESYCPGAGNGTFGASISHALGATGAFIAADFNGDGRNDLAGVFDSATAGADRIRIVLGTAAGTFSARSEYASGEAPKRLVAADFNQDGKPDLAVITGQPAALAQNVAILLGDGSGGFAAPLTYGMGALPNGNLALPASLAVGDVNGDGKADLVVGEAPIGAPSSYTGNLHVFIGDGLGGFSSPSKYPLPLRSTATVAEVALSDWNGDGALDVLVHPRNPSGGLFVLPGDGAGGFLAAVLIPADTPETDTPWVRLADIDADGRTDVIYASSLWSISSLLNTTGPSLSVSDVSVQEGDSGNTQAQFVVSLDAPPTQSVSASYRTIGISARAGVDFTPVSGVVTFPIGVSQQSVVVPIAADTTPELTETFFVSLGNPTNATIQKGYGVGTILTDDLGSPPFITDPSASAIGTTSATLGGTVISMGPAISQRGFVYSRTSENPNPLIDGSNVTTVKVAGTTGAFTKALSGLSVATGYSFKAFATNLAGTGYTPVSTFTTLSAPPGSPTITAFTASTVLLNPSETGTLSWSVSNATSVTLTAQRIPTGESLTSFVANPSGSLVIGPFPASDSPGWIFTLSAQNASGTVTRSVRVGVGDGTMSIGTPVITAPSQGLNVIVTGIGFSWNGVASATGYDLRVFDSASGMIVFLGSLVGGGSTSTLIDLPAGSYRFAVRACSGGFGPSQCGAYGTASFSVSPAAPNDAPTVTFPAEGAAFSNSTQTLSWTAVTPNPALPGLTYEVLLRDIATGQTALQISVPSPNLSTVFTMKSSTRYELKIRACQAGCGPYSTPVNFSVALPPVPTLQPTGLVCSVTGGNSLSCNWNAVVNSDVYQVQVVQPPPAGPGGSALTVAAKRVSTTSVTLPVPSGSATVLVSACNGDGCGPSAQANIISSSSPSSPNIGTPIAGAVVSGPAVLFTWNRVPGDSGSNTLYRLFVQDLSRQATAFDVHTTNNYYAGYFKAEGSRYDALVTSNPGLGNQAIGPAQGFNVAGVSAAAPTMVSPAHNSTVSSGNVQIGWSPVPGATLYEYFVAVLAQSNATVRGVTPGLFVSAPLSGTGAGTIYSGIVRACPAGAICVAGSDTGWGPWSNAPGGPGVTNFTVVP